MTLVLAQTTVNMALPDVMGAFGVAETVRGAGALIFMGEVLYAQATSAGFKDAFVALAGASFLGLLPTWILLRARLRP